MKPLYSYPSRKSRAHWFGIDDREINWDLKGDEEYEGDFLKEVPLTPLKNFWVKVFLGEHLR